MLTTCCEWVKVVVSEGCYDCGVVLWLVTEVCCSCYGCGVLLWPKSVVVQLCALASRPCGHVCTQAGTDLHPKRHLPLPFQEEHELRGARWVTRQQLFTVTLDVMALHSLVVNSTLQFGTVWKDVIERLHSVSRLGLVVRCSAGKQKDPGSTLCIGSTFS